MMFSWRLPARSSSRRVERAWRVAPVLLLVAVTASAQKLTGGAQSQSSEYHVGPRDVLAVMVVNEPSLSGKFNVLEDGTVSYPLIGTVRVGGLPVQAVQNELTTRLGDGYIEKPVVSVTVAEFGSRRVFVLGDVRQPGSFTLGTNMTVLEALLKAGGPTQTAGGRALVVRAGGETVTAGAAVAPVDLTALQQGDLTQNLSLGNGDLLFVPSAEAPAPVYVMGMVNNPGAYQLPKGATVVQALAQAGGVSDRGSTRRIHIVRKVDGKVVELKATPYDAVLSGDTVVVKKRYF